MCDAEVILTVLFSFVRSRYFAIAFLFSLFFFFFSERLCRILVLRKCVFLVLTKLVGFLPDHFPPLKLTFYR